MMKALRDPSSSTFDAAASTDAAPASMASTAPATLVIAQVPTLIAAAGETASRRFLEFFTVTIRNPNTREAYGRASAQFLAWCHERRFVLDTIEPMVVAAYIEELTQHMAPRSVKQHLAAIRKLFDWLVVGHVIPHNPAHAVRGPRFSATTGTTPTLTAEEARQLLEAIDTTHVVGLRDRALIGVMVYTFGRVSAVVGMNVEDYFARGKRWVIRLREKGGKLIDVPAHHLVEEYLDSYLDAAGIRHDGKSPLFRSAPRRQRQLTDHAIERTEVWEMIRRRAKDAKLSGPVCCHTFRGTGITAYLDNNGSLDHAQKQAGHADPRTTELYDRRGKRISLDEIEKIIL